MEHGQDIYVHGYDGKELERLVAQSRVLEPFLHSDTRYPAGSRVLEAGCGCGSQSVILGKNSPDAHFVSVDRSEKSLDRAKQMTDSVGIRNMEFVRADLMELSFERESFDHLFICFVLEHVPEPEKMLVELKKFLKPGGSITVIEGDHGSCRFYPETLAAMKVWNCLIRAQARAGGDSLIGRRVYPLLAGAGFRDVAVCPRMIYADASLPDMVEGFTEKTILDMVRGVRGISIEYGFVTELEWEQGIRDIERTKEADGTFSYTFYKGTALK